MFHKDKANTMHLLSDGLLTFDNISRGPIQDYWRGALGASKPAILTKRFQKLRVSWDFLYC